MPERADEVTVTAPANRKWFCCLLGLFFILIMAFAGGATYFHLFNTMTLLKQQIVLQHTELTSLKLSMDQLKQLEQKTEAITQQQEQVIADWKMVQKGDLNKWHVAEAQYLVKLANDHLLFTHETQLTLALLKRALQIVSSIEETQVADIRRSLSNDIDHLQAQTTINVTDLYLQLVAINNQIDQLTLPAQPLKAAILPMEPASSVWWKKGVDKFWQALKQIVIVRYDGANTLPLILPEEKNFLYQNVHAQFENAMWAVLHRQNAIYQASLTQLTDWLIRYFEDSELSKSLLSQLKALQEINIDPPTADLSETLKLFDQYFAGATQ